MIRKFKMSNVRSIWLHLHKLSLLFKKYPNDNEFFVRFWKFIQVCLNKSNSYPPRKEILNYITSRNMRRTLVPSDFLDEDKVQFQRNTLNNTKKKDTLGLVRLNYKFEKYMLNPVSQSILKFHSRTMLLGNLLSKKKTQEELESSWGGPEIYKLITFLKTLDEFISKNSEVVIFFSAYWCQHCHRLKKAFGSAALMAKKANLPVLFATFDVTIDPDIAVERGIVGIPLIQYYRKGKNISTYRGKRTAEDLFEFVKNPPLPGPETEKSDI